VVSWYCSRCPHTGKAPALDREHRVRSAPSQNVLIAGSPGKTSQCEPAQISENRMGHLVDVRPNEILGKLARSYPSERSVPEM
jgi:hypothetical protein